MASEETPSLGPALRVPQWRSEYEAALRETDRRMLFKRVEIAEASLLSQREALTRDSDGRVEKQELESALQNLRALKKNVLKFS
jgi:hypothetical protein